MTNELKSASRCDLYEFSGHAQTAHLTFCYKTNMKYTHKDPIKKLRSNAKMGHRFHRDHLVHKHTNREFPGTMCIKQV